MAADDVWWSVLGIWTIVWWVTMIALAGAIVILVLSWQRHGRPPKPSHGPGISLYLNDDSVMDFYLQGGHKTALRHEVQENIRSSNDADISAKVYGAVEAGAKRSVNREVFRKYIEVAEPITVVRIILEVLESADNIVYADLVNQQVEPGKALTKAVGQEAANRDSTLLSDFNLEAFVAVRGRFRETAKAEKTTTFTAPFGDALRAAGRPRVEVTCVTAGLRREVPSGAFQARCLGRVQGWDPDLGALVVDPIAIFQ